MAKSSQFFVPKIIDIIIGIFFKNLTESFGICFTVAVQQYNV